MLSFFYYLFSNPIFATVISGILVLVIGQIIQQLIIAPYLEYRRVVGVIDNKLKFYGNTIYSVDLPEEVVLETMREIRKLSCDLESVHKMMTVKIPTVPSKEEISESAKSLLLLSNSAGIKDREFMRLNRESVIKAEETIRKYLKIEKYSS